MTLRFHKRLFEILGETPSISESQAAVVAAAEKRCGVRFPAAVVELFSIEGVFDLFRDNTNEDALVTNTTQDPDEQLAALGDADETAQGYLRDAVENQAVVGWYVPLDKGDDPPVFHNNDDWDSPLSDVDWVECAASFSEFLVDMMGGD